MIKLKTTLILLTLLISTSLVAQDLFVRSAVIEPPSTYPSGFGATVSGVDLDGDGKLEIYSVDGMSDIMTGDEIPQIIKYELNGTSWDSVWAASFPNERQNTWAALTIGDLDNDGKKEIIWGFVNSFSVNATPPRVVVFEANGDDILGVSDGSGNFDPNTAWDMEIPASTNMRPLKWETFDIDGDGKEEIIFAERRDHFNFGIISVDDVPDAGSGSETWTMEFNKDTELYNQFVRSNVIDSPDGGFGGIVTNVDYDGDGLMDLYAVNDNWTDGSNGELIPHLYKYELVSGAFVLRWSTRLPGIDYQNTWPVLLSGDWDGDGKGEVIWCPVNNFGAGNEDPDRIVVYEFPGDSTSDAMGIDNGDGTWSPNAAWNMGVPASTSMRPFRGQLTDIDNDGSLEFVFAERHNYYVWGVVGVTDIPNTGDGSEVWTMEANGVPDAGNNWRDLAIIDQTMYLFSSNGEVRTITNDGTNYTVSGERQAYPGWSWLSANTIDIDGDGNLEVVTGDYSSGGTASVWVLVPDADSLVGHKVADFSANTSTRITNVRVGDINADGLVDFVVGFRGTDEVYRVAYNGGDITLEASYTTSLLDKGVLGTDGIGQLDMITVANIDGAGGDEVLYTGVPRSIPSNTQPLTIGSYSDTLKADATRRWDMVVANGAAHFFNGSGNLQSVYHDGNGYKLTKTQPGLVNGSFLSASAIDVDGDGTEEIIQGNWFDAKVNMLKWINGAWIAYEIANFADVGGNRLNGGSVGDIDGDGNVDFVTGSRQSVPNGQIYRVEYTGGDVMDAANWKGDVIDFGMNDLFVQYEVINIANLDDDDDLEVLYTSDYARGDNSASDAPFPIVILDLQKVESESIANVKIDTDGDRIPDRIGEQVVTMGIVTSLNFSSSGYLATIQDESAAIHLWSSGDTTSNYNIGDRVQVSGEVAQFRGLTEIYTTAADILFLGTATAPDPMVVTIAELQADPEKYESMLLKINAITLSGGTWPAEGSNANLDMTDGYLETRVRIDKDLDIDGQAEPVWPVNAIVIGAQYSSSSSTVDNGYQYFPRMYSDIEQNVAAPPSPYFFFDDETAAKDGGEYEITNVDEDYSLAWHPSVDLNGEALIYQVVGINDGNEILLDPSDNGAVDTVYTQTGQDVIDLILANSSDNMLEISYTIWTVSSNPAEGIISSVDTITVTFKDMVTDMNDRNIIPKEFFVDQNYPNPFNPTTTISFGLPTQAEVNLIIYDILGREVARLVNSEVMNAGVHKYTFDASRLASGTYIYRLQADKKVEVKKMLLLK